jgi:hypothetical protein
MAQLGGWARGRFVAPVSQPYERSENNGLSGSRMALDAWLTPRGACDNAMYGFRAIGAGWGHSASADPRRWVSSPADAGNPIRKMPSDPAAPGLAISLDLDPSAPRAARYHLARFDPLSPDLRDAVMLLTSELVTRAVQQCRPASGEGVELRVWMRARAVRVELRAPGKLLCLPLKRDGPNYDVLLLRHVADRWSIETAQYPACMWFEIDRHRSGFEPEPEPAGR